MVGRGRPNRNSGPMNAREYCERVEQEERLQQQKRKTTRVADDGSPLISLKGSGFKLEFEPSFMENYRYLVREAVFDKVGRMSKRLHEQDKMLIIRSAWRSFRHQRLIWDKRVESLRQANPEVHQHELEEMAAYFIAPETESMHSTGGAVDALIRDMRTKGVMDFGTNDGLIINLSRKCYPDHPDLTPEATKNRRLLIDLFEEEGFVCDLQEYWHFDYGNVMWAIQNNEACAIYDCVEAY